MELSLLPYQQQHASSLLPTPVMRNRPYNWNSSVVRCCCTSSVDQPIPSPLLLSSGGRRALMGCFLTAAAGIYICDKAAAVSTSRRALKGAKIPESEYTTLPNGLKYYDLKVGGGPEAVKGSRVAVRLLSN